VVIEVYAVLLLRDDEALTELSDTDQCRLWHTRYWTDSWLSACLTGLLCARFTRVSCLTVSQHSIHVILNKFVDNVVFCVLSSCKNCSLCESSVCAWVGTEQWTATQFSSTTSHYGSLYFQGGVVMPSFAGFQCWSEATSSNRSGSPHKMQ